MTAAHAVGDLAVMALAAGATYAAWRRSVGTAVGVVLAALVASSGSLRWLEDPFRAGRWAALLTLAALVAGRLLRVPRAALLPWAYVGCLPLLGLLSVAWAVDPRLALGRAVTFGAVLFVAAGCGILWAADERERRSLADAIAVVSIATLCASVVYAIASDNAYLNGDLRGILENPNGLGVLLGLTYPFVAASLEQHGRASMRLVPFCAFVATAAVSDSRSGLGSLVIGGVGYELARRRHVWAGLATVAAGLTTVAVVAVTSLTAGPPEPAGPEPPRPWIAALTGGRNEAWEATAKLIADRPALGYGFGAADQLFDRYPEKTRFVWFVGSTPHNGYLHAVAELGVLGAFLVAPLVLAGVLAVGLLLRDDRLPATSAALAVLCGLAVGLVESAFFAAGAPWALLIWVSAAMCLAHVVERPRRLENGAGDSVRTIGA